MKVTVNSEMKFDESIAVCLCACDFSLIIPFFFTFHFLKLGINKLDFSAGQEKGQLPVVTFWIFQAFCRFISNNVHLSLISI